jgi:hypothetical protein
LGKALKAGFQKGWLLSPFLSLFIAEDRENLGIGMENLQRDGFFGSLIKRAKKSNGKKSLLWHFWSRELNFSKKYWIRVLQSEIKIQKENWIKI